MVPNRAVERDQAGSYVLVVDTGDDGVHVIVGQCAYCQADFDAGIVEGVINTVHAYTNDQRLADVPHSDWRRSRAAAENIIPTSTGAAKAVGQVLPDLQGKLHGIAARVPVPDGSVVDLFAKLGKSVSVDDVHAAVREASESARLRGILQYSETPIVSSDIIGNSHSSVYDSGFTGVTGGRYLRVLNWYDNEWGYSCRVCDLLGRMDAW